MNGLSKFSDLIPSIIVKDFRQLLRSKPAWISILLIWLVVGLGTISFMGSDGFASALPKAESYYCWIILALMGLVLCLFLPLIGGKSMKQDLALGNKDFIILTGQTSWSIVFYKWVSIMLQVLCVTMVFSFWILILMTKSYFPFAQFFDVLFKAWIISAVLSAIFLFINTLASYGKIIFICLGAFFFLGSIGKKTLMLQMLCISETISTGYSTYGFWGGLSLTLSAVCSIVSLIAVFLLLAEKAFQSDSQLGDLKMRLLGLLPILGLVLAIISGANQTIDYTKSMWYMLGATQPCPTSTQWLVYLNFITLLAVTLLSLSSSSKLHYAQYIRGSKKHLPIIPHILQVSGWVPSLIWGLCLFFIGCFIAQPHLVTEFDCNLIMHFKGIEDDSTARFLQFYSYSPWSLFVVYMAPFLLPLPFLYMNPNLKLTAKLMFYPLIYLAASIIFFICKFRLLGEMMIAPFGSIMHLVRFKNIDTSNVVFFVLLAILALLSIRWFKDNAQARKKAKAINLPYEEQD